MNRKETKEDIFQLFTKDELIQYLRRKVYLSSGELANLKAELLYLRWELESVKAREMMDDAVQGSQACTKRGGARAEWLNWQKKFDQAQKAWEKADAIYKEAERLRAQKGRDTNEP